MQGTFTRTHRGSTAWHWRIGQSQARVSRIGGNQKPLTMSVEEKMTNILAGRYGLPFSHAHTLLEELGLGDIRLVLYSLSQRDMKGLVPEMARQPENAPGMLEDYIGRLDSERSPEQGASFRPSFRLIDVVRGAMPRIPVSPEVRYA